MQSSTRKALPFASLLAGAALVAAATPAAAQIDSDKLSIHGFLTQGFGMSSDHPVLGISADHPTSDYRAAALQIRYALTDKDNFVVQLNHRRVGENPLGQALENVDFGWAFYQRQVGNGSIKIGRAPTPTGFFNETRFVGTLNPLYRAPVTIYAEGREAVDGVLLNQRVALAGGWDVSATGYIGGQTTTEIIRTPVPTGNGQQTIITSILPLRIDRSYGGQVMFSTPIDGVRFGGDASYFKINDMADGRGGTLSFGSGSTWGASAEVVRAIGSLRGEYKRVQLTGIRTGSYYGQGIANVTEQLALVGQVEFTDDELGGERAQRYRDAAAGVRFALHPNVVFKLEGHQARGRTFFDVYASPTAPALETTYGLASVSLSF